MDSLLRFLIFFLVINLTSCMFADDDGVVVLTDANYQGQLLDSEDLWLVEFYTPWSSECKELVPKIVKAAHALKGFVKVGVVDITKNSAITDMYKVSSFPLIKTFGRDKRNPTDYKGAIGTAKDIVGGGFTLLQQTLRVRMGLKKKRPKPINDKLITKLTTRNFDKDVMASDDIWVVDFYAPWCGYCKKFLPYFKTASVNFAGKIRFGMVDSTVEDEIADKYKVEGFPSIKVFPKGVKNLRNIKDFEGEDEEFDQYLTAVLDPNVKLPSGPPPGSDDPEEEDPNSKVIKLTGKNFEAEVLKTEDLWLVEFYAPWCGHCKQLAPEWESAAVKLLGKAKLGKIDSTVESGLSDTYKIEGFPTIYVFKPGQKSKPPVEYQDEHNADSIYKYATQILGVKITDGEEEEEGNADVITLDSAEKGDTTVDLGSGEKTIKTHEEL